MMKFLLERPIGVLLSFIGLIVLSVLGASQLPISLLPDLDVPTIYIKVNYPNSSATEIDKYIVKPIRENMLTLSSLCNVESKSNNETATLELTFDYGVDMNLAYIEVNEKVDRLSDQLPSDLVRPQIVKVNTSDIPIARIQVVPKDVSQILNISEVALKSIKKRLEQLPGVSIVDISGTRNKIYSVTPETKKLNALGLSNEQLIQSIESNNIDLGSVSVKDGQYRFYVKITNKLTKPIDLDQIALTLASGSTIPLSEVAQVMETYEDVKGLHYYNQNQGLVITVHKQAQARMTELIPRLNEAINQFRIDYPQIQIEITQDQSLLLKTSINNLQLSLLFGGFFAFFILFLFMDDYRLPLIMGLSLPTSLALSFIPFYLFGLSINIISLSGLALGIGMLIDNAIVVLDNIHRKRAQDNLIQSCTKGVTEVMTPLLSSVLTTMAVFLPLIFIGGKMGVLFFDQAVAVGAILGVSLIVAFILLPLLYKLFYNNTEQSVTNDTKAFLKFSHYYKHLFDLVFRHKMICLSLLLLLIPITLGIALFIKKEGLPKFQTDDLVLRLNWNEPIGVEENLRRVFSLTNNYDSELKTVELDIGLRQFIFHNTDDAIQSAVVYLQVRKDSEKNSLVNEIDNWIGNNYPRASYAITDAPNTFSQIFIDNDPYFNVKWKNLTKNATIPKEVLYPIADSLRLYFPGLKYDFGLIEETAIKLTVNQDKVTTYGIEYERLLRRLEQLLGAYKITTISSFGEVTPVLLTESLSNFFYQTNNVLVQSNSGAWYPIKEFVNYHYTTEYKHVTADKSGVYQGLTFDQVSNIDRLIEKSDSLARKFNLSIEYSGQYFSDKANLIQLVKVLLISLVLLYFILAAQFESLMQPFIVILTLPLGIGGSLLMLFLSGSSLNIMSGIGIVVMLGIIVNDSILKIDTINRKRRTLGLELDVAITETGMQRLKPILMTSATTILALLPLMFSSGIAADLQKPLVWSVLGGLTIGTFAALVFVPLAYWFIERTKQPLQR